MIRPLNPSNDDDIPFGPSDGISKPYDPLDKDADCFKPPAEPIEVGCLHCQGIFSSSQMTWRIERCHDGKDRGFWCCPDPACDGRGFGFDLHPTDPNDRDENGGWVYCDDEDEFDVEDFDEGQASDLDNIKPSESFDPPKDWTGDDEEEDIPF